MTRAQVRASSPSRPTTTASGSIAGSSGICPTPASPPSPNGRAPGSCASTARAPRRATGIARGPDAARAARRARAAPIAKPERERPPLTDDEIAFAREMVIHQDAQAFVLNKPPGLATQGGTKTHRACRRPARRAAVRRRGPAQAGPPARQGHVGRAARRAHRARRGVLRQGLFGPHRARRSIGRWSSACPRSRTA